MDEIDAVEETQVKERKCILLRIRGGKQFVLQCDVSVPWASPLGAGHLLPPASHPLRGASHFGWALTPRCVVLASPGQAVSPGAAGSPALTCALPRRVTPSWCSGGRSCGTPSARRSSCCSECRACRTSPARPWWSSAKCRSSSAPPTGSDRAPSSPPLIYWVGFPRAPAPRHPWAGHCRDAPCHIQPCAQAPLGAGEEGAQPPAGSWCWPRGSFPGVPPVLCDLSS